jgi:hypothetical protein
MTTRRQVEQLRQRQSQPPAPLTEVLRGSIVERSVRCGKPTCRCATGEGHTTYYLAVGVPPGKTLQITLPPELVPLARRWNRNFRRWRQVLERISTLNRELLRHRWVETSSSTPRKPRKRRA